MGIPVFSPDSQRMVVWASAEKKEFVVLDGKAQTNFDEVDPWQLIFSPDSKHVAYKAKKDKKWFLAVDNTASSNFFQYIITAAKGRSGFIFDSPDSLHYIGYLEKDKKLYLIEEAIIPATGGE
jgi:hypothetical protein